MPTSNTPLENITQQTNHLQMRDASSAVLNSMTEAEMASWCRQQGGHVVYHRGRYWQELRRGFYQPVNLVSSLTVEQATPPTPFCWGFRAAMYEKDFAAANGSIPVHVLTDVAAYDLDYLPQKNRTHIRKCRKLARIVQLTTPTLLQQQGYEVVCSSLQRTQHQKPPSLEKYLATLNSYTTDKYRLVLAALIGDKLGGYIDGYAVDGTAYAINGYYATEALSASIVTGLTFEFVQICRRAGNIHQIVDGSHLRESPGLCSTKEKMGFPVKHIPAFVSMNPIIKQYLRWRSPHKYYRLSGQSLTPPCRRWGL